MRFFTSDTHFGHARIIELSDRPFNDVDHMNSEIVRRWNEVVSPDDTVYHLGDVALGSIADSLPIVSRLNGFKVMVTGNHDRLFSTYSNSHRERFDPEYRKVFQEVVQEAGTYIDLGDGTKVRLSHFPHTGDSHDADRYSDMRPADKGFPIIHGHTHGKERLTFTAQGTPQIHVGQDVWDFTPVSEDEILDLLA